MPQKKSVKDINVKGKRVFCRVDFNVPIKNGKVDDETRIKEALPTINYIIGQGGRLILASHLGRPSGKGYEAEYSLKPVADHLSKMLNKPVKFANDCASDAAVAMAKGLKDSEILLLENLRFYKEEETKDVEKEKVDAFAAKLASMAEVYVSDAFGTAHRKHSSMYGVAKKLSPKVAGFLMQKEIEYFDKAVEAPKRPLCVILGGAKVSDKIKVIENLLKLADQVLIGGAMAYTFSLAKGGKVGKSLVEPEQIDAAKKIMELAKQLNKELLLPVDTVCADKFSKDSKEAVNVKTVKTGEIPDGWQGMDIGPDTIKQFAAKIKSAKTVIWNGPMGVFENDKFAQGTNAVAKAVAESGSVSIIGGGDSVSAINKSGLSAKISHISTGGGASLELLEGKVLPGLDVLDNA